MHSNLNIRHYTVTSVKKGKKIPPAIKPQKSHSRTNFDGSYWSAPKPCSSNAGTKGALDPMSAGSVLCKISFLPQPILKGFLASLLEQDSREAQASCYSSRYTSSSPALVTLSQFSYKWAMGYSGWGLKARYTRCWSAHSLVHYPSRGALPT